MIPDAPKKRTKAVKPRYMSPRWKWPNPGIMERATILFFQHLFAANFPHTGTPQGICRGSIRPGRWPGSDSNHHINKIDEPNESRTEQKEDRDGITNMTVAYDCQEQQTQWAEKAACIEKGANISF
ncbi:hypothetical protein P7H21_06780 [Paenibacillus larvae]|nr:hypothetical protein [Paenibacillus larvae]MDT2303770.1 hypothetical protein [Paenibacillus larvae]